MIRKLLFANFKLIYRFNQWLRRRLTPTGTLILLVMPVAGVFGFDTRTTFSSQIFSITLLLLLSALLFTFALRGKYSIYRKLPEYGSVGTPINYVCVVNNKSNVAKRGLVLIDELKHEFPSIEAFAKAKDPLEKRRNRIDRLIGYPRMVNAVQKLRGGSIKSVAIDYITEKSEATVHMQLIPLRRGYLQFDKTHLAQTEPLGLLQSQKTIKNKDRLLILPKLYNTPRLDLDGKRTFHLGGINNASIVGDSQEFMSLRDYHPGDPIRSIHWRSYAKLNKPIVKEYQDEYFTRYGLILDTFLDNSSDVVFEDAVSVAASFITAEREQDTLLDLMFVGDKSYRITSGRGLAATESILEILACVAGVYESNINEVERLIKQSSHECSAIICVLLTLDKPRLNLINLLSSLGMPIKCLIICDDGASENLTALNNEDIHLLRHSTLQVDLDKLWTS